MILFQSAIFPCDALLFSRVDNDTRACSDMLYIIQSGPLCFQTTVTWTVTCSCYGKLSGSVPSCLVVAFAVLARPTFFFLLFSQLILFYTPSNAISIGYSAVQSINPALLLIYNCLSTSIYSTA
jgi:hypothetical protein